MHRLKVMRVFVHYCAHSVSPGFWVLDAIYDDLNAAIVRADALAKMGYGVRAMLFPDII